MADPQYKNSNGMVFPDRNLCIYNNSGSTFINLEININFEKWYTPFFASFPQDISHYSCELSPVKEVLLSY